MGYFGKLGYLAITAGFEYLLGVAVNQSKSKVRAELQPQTGWLLICLQGAAFKIIILGFAHGIPVFNHFGTLEKLLIV
jgi:hypothetical protein